MIHRSLVEWFPSLAGIRFTHAWGGPVGMPRDWMRAVNFDLNKHRVGYTGQGVSTSNLAGKLLAGLITNRQTGLELLPLAQRRSPNWEVEPLRWLVVRTLLMRELHNILAVTSENVNTHVWKGMLR